MIYTWGSSVMSLMLATGTSNEGSMLVMEILGQVVMSINRYGSGIMCCEHQLKPDLPLRRMCCSVIVVMGKISPKVPSHCGTPSGPDPSCHVSRRPPGHAILLSTRPTSSSSLHRCRRRRSRLLHSPSPGCQRQSPKPREHAASRCCERREWL